MTLQMQLHGPQNSKKKTDPRYSESSTAIPNHPETIVYWLSQSQRSAWGRRWLAHRSK